jgi:basic membrane protein A
MAYDIGGRGDKGFNDSAALGLDWLKTVCGVTAREVTVTAGSDSEREDKLRLLAKAGFNPIIAVGFLYSFSINKVAVDYPNTQFVLLDDASYSQLPNVFGALFSEQEGGYLAGLAAALATKSRKVGYIGSVNAPLIQRFEAGFVAGVKRMNPLIAVEVKYVSEVPNFSGLNDPNKARNIASGMVDRGIDIIYSPSSGSIVGVANLARDSQTMARKLLVIGNDTDLYYSHCATLSAAIECNYILTSVVKNLNETVFDLVNRYSANGILKSEIEPRVPGKRFGVKESGFSLSRSGGILERFWVTIESEIELLKSGSVKVP